MTDELKVAVVPGDDAAPEAVNAVMHVLHAMELPIAWGGLPDGVELARSMPRAEGEAMVIDAANRSDTVLFGSTSGQTPGVGYFRWGRQTYANVRPIKWRPGFRSPLVAPEGIDYVIVRENLEDLYAGIEGDLREVAASGLADRPRFGGVSRTQLPGGFEHFKDADGRYAIKYFTRANVERVAHFACRLAQRRLEQGYPGKVTCSAKYNVLTKTDGWFVELAGDVAAELPGRRIRDVHRRRLRAPARRQPARARCRAAAQPLRRRVFRRGRRHDRRPRPRPLRLLRRRLGLLRVGPRHPRPTSPASTASIRRRRCSRPR